ncbi:hypothetical protein [Virgibacillus kimchii]
MNYDNYIKQSLYYRMLPVYESDIPFIYQLICEMNQTETALDSFPGLNMERPITIVDKELMV